MMNEMESKSKILIYQKEQMPLSPEKCMAHMVSMFVQVRGPLELLPTHLVLNAQ